VEEEEEEGGGGGGGGGEEEEEEGEEDAPISQIYYWNETPRVSDRSSVHHQ
jgi:hypothetical protein